MTAMHASANACLRLGRYVFLRGRGSRTLLSQSHAEFFSHISSSSRTHVASKHIIVFYSTNCSCQCRLRAAVPSVAARAQASNSGSVAEQIRAITEPSQAAVARICLGTAPVRPLRPRTTCDPHQNISTFTLLVVLAINLSAIPYSLWPQASAHDSDYVNIIKVISNTSLNLAQNTRCVTRTHAA
jgi:hypothetical protein